MAPLFTKPITAIISYFYPPQVQLWSQPATFVWTIAKNDCDPNDNSLPDGEIRGGSAPLKPLKTVGSRHFDLQGVNLPTIGRFMKVGKSFALRRGA